jgi:hypothetical protein
MAAVGGAGVGGGEGNASSMTTVTLSRPECHGLQDNFDMYLDKCIARNPASLYGQMLTKIKEINAAIKENRASPATTEDRRFAGSRNYITDNVVVLTEAIGIISSLEFDEDEEQIKAQGFDNRDAARIELRTIRSMYEAILKCHRMSPNGSVLSMNSRDVSPATPFTTTPSPASPGRKRSRRNRRKSRSNRRKSRNNRRKSRKH